MYLQKDSLGLATVLTTGLFTVCGKKDLVSRDATVGHPLLTPKHPDDHIRHAVLGLDTREWKQHYGYTVYEVMPNMSSINYDLAWANQ